MRQLIVRYDDHGTSKTLPKRGALFASRPEALASHWMQWALLNFALCLFPAMTGLFGFLFVLSCFGAHGISRDEFAYVFAYFSVSAGTSLLSTTHAIFRGLQQHIKEAITKLPDSADDALRTGLVEAHLKLSDYYTKFDQSRYYLWASLLDPGISYERLKADYDDNPDLLAELESSKIQLESHYEFFYAPDRTPSTSSSTTPPPTAESSGSPQKVDFLARKIFANEPVFTAVTRRTDGTRPYKPLEIASTGRVTGRVAQKNGRKDPSRRTGRTG
ncbi:hypothetical protein C8R44DRAFT_726475 [Mycena epipterygia]|nr:hypothetical protein C8R44DRAFT_726475 [Mycena epipterygia]